MALSIKETSSDLLEGYTKQKKDLEEEKLEREWGVPVQNRQV